MCTQSFLRPSARCNGSAERFSFGRRGSKRGSLLIPFVVLCLSAAMFLNSCGDKQPPQQQASQPTTTTRKTGGPATQQPRVPASTAAGAMGMGSAGCDESAYHAELGQVHLRYGKNQLAFAELNQAIELAVRPDAKAQYHSLLFQAALATGDEAAAESHLLQAIELAENPDSRRSFRQNLAQIYLRLGKADKAEFVFVQILNETQDKFQRREIIRQQLNALNVQNKLDAAVADFEKRLKDNPDDEDAIFGLFEIYYSLKRVPKKAVTAAEIMAEREPTNENWLHVLVNLYDETGLYDDLISVCEKLIATNPSDTGRRLQFEQTIARAWAKKGDPQKAIAIMESLVAEAKEPQLRQQLEMTMFSLYNEAKLMPKLIARLEEKLKAAPDDIETLRKLCSIFTGYEPDMKRAVEICERIEKLTPADLENLKRLAQLCLQAQLPDKALAYYEKLANLEPAMKMNYLEQIASLHLSRHDIEKAVAIYKEIVEGLTGLAKAMQCIRMANLYANEKDIPRAEQWIGEALECGGKEPQLYSSAADLFSTMGNQEKALEFVKKAVDASPDANTKAQYRFRLAALLEQTGKPDDAEAVLRQVMKDAASKDIVNQAKGLLIDLCRRTGKLEKIQVEEK